MPFLGDDRMQRILISAHSGSRHSEPTTYEHFDKALVSGAEYVEMDLRRTADGIWIAYHDTFIDRCGMKVSDISYSEICKELDYSVPRVERIMEQLAGKVAGHLDLKEEGFEDEVVQMAVALLGSGNFIVTSLEDSSVARIKRAYPRVRTALSLGRDMEGASYINKTAIRLSELRPLRRVYSCRADCIAVNYKLARLGVLGQCARHRIGSMVWTVNSDKLIDHFLRDSRVCVLITDRPEYAVQRREYLLPL